MNNGAFGEGFPYSNFHDLNMDWITKIAKDFLDQYTHIQEIIEQGKTDIQDLTTSGLEQLQEKADNLEALLQEWYNTHSEDIANQLADALNDLNDWYNTHEGYLNQYVADSKADFNAYAEAKGQSVIDSIPADYTSLYNMLITAFDVNSNYKTGDIRTYNNNLYRAKHDISAGAFNSSDWEQIVNSTELGKIIGRIFNTDSDYAEEIANGTDIDTIKNIGNYKIRTYSNANTMIHLPDINAGRLLVFTTSQTTARGVFQIWISNSSDLRLFIRRQDNNDTWNTWNKILIEADVIRLIQQETLPYKLRLMQYNLGKFNKGFDHDDDRGIDQTLLPEYISKFKKFMGKYQPDICGFEEYSTYIDKADTTYPTDDLFTPLYKYSSNVSTNICVKSNFNFTSDTYHNINLPDNTSIAILRETPITIRGKHFNILTGYFRVAMSSEYHITGFNTLMNYIDTLDNVIIMIDSNFHNETERNTIVNMATQHGMKVANNGYFGEFNTLMQTEYYKPIDSIYVKGNDIFMVNTFVPEEAEELMSDHAPIITDIHIL